MIMMPQLGKPQFNRQLDRVWPTVDCSGDEPLTVQADKDQVDINRIIARIEKGQTVPVLNGEPFYGDVSELGGLQEAIIKVQEANDLFMSYPASVREQFDNDPVKMVEYLENEPDWDEAAKLGLVNPRPKVEEPKPAAPAAAAAEGGKAQ